LTGPRTQACNAGTIILSAMAPSPSVPAKTVPISSGTDLKSDPRWHLVERILRTPPFQKSANLHALLAYLAEHSIRGRTEALTERNIGIGAFGKPGDYSPAEDSAVRVHVRQLRLRLHEYFACEGRHEDLLVEIPKGSYLLEFHPAQTEPISAPQPGPKSAPAEVETSRPGLRTVVFWVAVAAALFCGIGWYRAVREPAPIPVPWPLNAVIQPNQDTRVVVSDGNLMLRLLGHKEITLDQYLQPGFRQSLIPPHLDPRVSPLVTYISDSQLTSFADLVVASSLLRVARQTNHPLELYPAQNLSLRDLEQGNYVFVGSDTSNPWVGLFSDELNFVVVEDGVGGKMYFRNKHPLPGEQATYEGLPRTGSAGEEYADISLLPSTSGRGNVLILQGLRQEGTEALGELLEEANDRTQLERALDHGNNAHAPLYFEALIRARAVAGAPVSINIVATRILHPTIAPPGS
jgi:hypothetical protein